MKISATKKIAIEDFPNEQRSWLTKLLTPVNKFLEQTYFALSNGITIADNLKAQKFDISVTAGQPYPIKVSWNLNEKPTAVFLGYITEDNGAPGAIGPHSMQWQFSNGTIDITFNGLNAAKAYRATVIGIV